MSARIKPANQVNDCRTLSGQQGLVKVYGTRANLGFNEGP